MARPLILLYGGVSAEHEISCVSAALVLSKLDAKKYDVLPVGVTKEGAWIPQDLQAQKKACDKPLTLDHPIAGKKPTKDKTSRKSSGPRGPESFIADLLASAGKSTDLKDLVVLPMTHGTFGESGDLQGYLTLCDIAFVGSGTLGASVGMDKCTAKRLVAGEGIPVVPWVEIRKGQYLKSRDNFHRVVGSEIGYPAFVKPASLGSSVGISRVKNRKELEKACELAFRYDEKILVEKGLSVREIESALIGGDDLLVSTPGELGSGDDFYTYDAKYVHTEKATIKIPADLTPAQVSRVQGLSRTIYSTLNLYGMCRVDLFLDVTSNVFYFNEVNTIPGFTKLSQFPLLWQHDGFKHEEILDRLVDLAVERQEATRALKRDFTLDS